MTLCVYVKHGEIARHESMVDFVLDYQECADQIGFEVWEEAA